MSDKLRSTMVERPRMGVYELSICRRCKQEIPKGGVIYIPGYGIVCYSCCEVLAGDDDYNDPYTGEKIL